MTTLIKKPKSKSKTSSLSSIDYIKWTDIDEETVHIGVLTKEDDEYITFLTKYGEMTILRKDGIFEMSSREEFELVIVPEIEEKSTIIIGESKMARATLIYQEMIKVNTNRRIDIIRKFM